MAGCPSESIERPVSRCEQHGLGWAQKHAGSATHEQYSMADVLRFVAWRASKAANERAACCVARTHAMAGAPSRCGQKLLSEVEGRGFGGLGVTHSFRPTTLPYLGATSYSCTLVSRFLPVTQDPNGATAE